MSFKSLDFISVQVPQLRCVVSATCEHALAVGGKGDRLDIVGMTFESLNFLAV
jgi:hypothetical protein